MTKSKKSSSLMSYAGTFGALVILCVVQAIASPNFFKYSNMMSVLKQTSFNALVSTGMLLCLITAGIDLSVGANATFAACLAGMLVNKGMNNPVLLLVVAIVGGTLIGWINGMLLTRLHLPHPFVSTLGMKNVLWGGALIITNSQMVSFSGNNAVMWLGSSTVAGFPVSFIVVLVIYVIMHILLTKTALGRSIYCVGGNPEAAAVSGISVFGVTMGAFILACGAKGKRMALPNAEIMIHQPSGGAQGQATEIDIVAQQILKTRHKLNSILAQNTGQTLETIARDTERDNYMTAQEAMAYGLIDSVIEHR